MRRLSAVALLLPCFVASGLPTPATAARMTACIPPKMSGFTVLSLRAAHISCDAAQRLMRTTIYYGAASGYACRRTSSVEPNLITASCAHRQRSSRRFAGTYRRA